MVVNIIEPDGSVKGSIPLQDIDHIETRTLSFFGEKAHNFYLFLKKDQGGYFVLLTYKCPLNMEQAKLQLQDTLQNKIQEAVLSQDKVFKLFPFSAPGTEVVEQA